MRTSELVEVSQDREAWHELVVACIDPQPPDVASCFMGVTEFEATMWFIFTE